jgi:hypothetical protein
MNAHNLFWWEEADSVPDELLAEADAADREAEARELELDRAAADVQNAHARYEEALRRVRCAPHGELASRRAALTTANQRILQAEVRFAEIKRLEPRWD